MEQETYPEEGSGILSSEEAAQFSMSNIHAEEDATTLAGEIVSEIPVQEVIQTPKHKYPLSALDERVLGTSSRGITKSTKKDSNKVRKEKKAMAKHNSKKIRHHKTKKEKKFR